MIKAQSPNTVNIVLIEDDEDDYVLTEALLSDGFPASYTLDWVQNYRDGLDSLISGQYDIALVDYRLGPECGLDLIAEAKRRGLPTPVILLTGQGDESLDANAIEFGASDYLVKGLVDSLGLARSIRYAIDRFSAVERLAISESRYRLLFDENPEPLLVVSPVTQEILSLNAAAHNLYRFDDSPTATAGLYLDRLLPEPRQRGLIGVSANPANFIPTPGAALTLHQRQDGSLFYAEITTNDIVLNQQPALLMMVVDVTEKMQALQRADQNEEAFLQLLKDLRDATLVIDDVGEIHFANPAAEQLLNLSSGSVAELGLDVSLKAEVSTVEQEVEITGGETLWVEIQCSPTRWHGKPMQLLSIRDVSERMASQKQLKLLQRGIEASSNGISIVDASVPDLPLIYVNSAFEHITGYSAEEVLGSNCRFLQGNDGDRATASKIREAIDQDKEISVVIKNKKKDGTVFWNDLYIAPVPDEAGNITHYIGIQNDISARKSAESALAYNSSHDVLTGLPNRSLLADRLRQAREFALRHGRQLALLYIDLDDFKLINDSLGHAVGDQVIVDVAERLTRILRAGDTVARLNADEFVVLLPDLESGEHAIVVAEQLLSAIAARFETDGHTVHVTASIGITLDDRSADDPIALLQHADLAMQRAKHQGRNTYQWYSSDLNKDASKKVVLRNELQLAIEEEQLTVFYQPLIDSSSGKVMGNEALVRWIHPEKGLVPPSDFLPVAEDSGQILQIGTWVLERACADTQRLRDHGFTDCTVAVNVAALQLRQTNFVDIVRKALDQSGLPPSSLELEIVESVLLQDTDQVIAAMNELKSIGIGISIDDFGTGFSSLSYIKILPATKIKIDRAFIKDVISDKSDSAITQGVISLAHHLELKTVAEGVETESQAAFLRKNRCDLMQGFLFSRPVPLDVLIEFMTQNLAEKALGKSDPASGNAKTILLLDDEENILKALSRTLRRDGYRILTAQTASEAFDHLACNNVQVVVSDQRMPEISGTEFLSQVKKIYPDTTRIVLSGYTDLRSVTEAINQGSIYKFLTKPWDDRQIRDHIAEAFRHRTMSKNDE